METRITADNLDYIYDVLEEAKPGDVVVIDTPDADIDLEETATFASLRIVACGCLYASGSTIDGDVIADGATISDITIGEPSDGERRLFERIARDAIAGVLELEMEEWHGDDWRRDKPGYCGTSHCLAGAAQALSDDPKIRSMHPLVAGQLLLPNYSYLFFMPNEVVMRAMRKAVGAEGGAS